MYIYIILPEGDYNYCNLKHSVCDQFAQKPKQNNNIINNYL